MLGEGTHKGAGLHQGKGFDGIYGGMNSDLPRFDKDHILCILRRTKSYAILDLVRRLEGNAVAYQEMQSHPILANGNEKIAN